MSLPFPFYRALHRGTEGDVDFYRRVASGASTILELGCGDGRIARPLAADGHRVVALDASREALDHGRAAPHGDRVEWVLGAMEGFDLGRRFDRIVAPYNAVYCLTTREAQLDCFSAVAAHLAEGGYFVFDAWAAEAFHEEGDEDDAAPDEVARITVDGRDYRVLESSRWDRATCFLDVTYTYVPLDGGAPLETKIPQRYLLLDDLHALLQEAGLEPLVVHGGFDQHVFDEESEWMVVTAALP